MISLVLQMGKQRHRGASCLQSPTCAAPKTVLATVAVEPDSLLSSARSGAVCSCPSEAGGGHVRGTCPAAAKGDAAASQTHENEQGKRSEVDRRPAGPARRKNCKLCDPADVTCTPGQAAEKLRDGRRQLRAPADRPPSGNVTAPVTYTLGPSLVLMHRKRVQPSCLEDARKRRDGRP